MQMFLISSKAGGPKLVTESLMTLIVSSVNFPKNGETSTVINWIASVTRNFIKKVALNEEKVAERE